MADTKKLLVLIGGILAVIGQWWGGASPNYYLPLIGGALAIIGGLMK